MAVPRESDELALESLAACRLFADVDRRTLFVAGAAAGAAAGVAAIFKAPATGAVFALEVPYQDGWLPSG